MTLSNLFLSTYRHQNFTFPNSMMHYIAKNPKNTKFYQKMVKICKYFFIKNPILILSNSCYFQNGWETWIKDDWKNIDMNKLSCKLWITDRLRVYKDDTINGTFDSSVFLKIYRCDAKYLSFYDQVIFFNKLMFLCSSVEHLDLHRVTVKYNDGTEVSFENLIKKLPQLKGIVFTFATPSNNTSKNTFKELWKIPHLSNYDRFEFYNIPEDFDIESFYSFMKNNKNADISLSFSNAISAEYKARLKVIIVAENHEYNRPMISFE